MDNDVRKIIKKVNKKQRIKIADIWHDEDDYSIILSDGYAHDDKPYGIIVSIPELNVDLIEKVLSHCDWIGCRTCPAKSTSRCTRRCKHFSERF